MNNVFKNVQKRTVYIQIIVTLVLLLSSVLYSSARGELSVKSINTIEEEALFNLMRKNFHDKIVLGADYDVNDVKVKAKINSIATNANTYWNNMEKSPVSYLWSNYNGLKDNAATAPKHVNGSYWRLLIMAQAYAYKSSSLYKNQQLLSDIIMGLNFMHSYAFNQNTQRIGNFWEWRIGIPDNYARIISILYDELPSAVKQNYTVAVTAHVRNFTVSGNLTYANQASICKSLFYCGVLSNNMQDIRLALDNLVRAFVDNTTLIQRKSAQIAFEKLWKDQGDYHNYSVLDKEGLYEDGTFIQHIALPYIGTYGSEIIGTSSLMIAVLEGTGIGLSGEIKASLLTWIKKAYFPAFYDGEMMRMFMGRGVTKNPFELARRVALDIAETTAILDNANDKKEIREVCKRMFTHNSYYTDIYNGIDPVIDKPRLDELLNDASLNNATSSSFNLVLTAGDRIIHHRPGFRFGISMSSSRIGKFESINNENTKGWYLGDGMTYLYNSDRSQYVNYFSNVDTKRLPGTTVDVIERQATVNNYGLFGIPTNAKDWAGGVSLRKFYGTAGMHLVGEVSSLEAKKSWFMFDNEIVALGAGIKLTEARNVETIIENRQSLQALIVDNVSKPATKGWTGTLDNPSWIYLEGTSGYYFPEQTAVNAYRDNNGFTQLYINHGVSPSSGKYAYVLLPGETKQGTSDYSVNPDIQILSNTDKIQAVLERKLNVIGVNFWEAGEIDIVKSDHPASVMLQRTQDTVYLSASDPTWKQSEIRLKIKGNYHVVSESGRVSILVNGSDTDIRINTADRMGMSEDIILVSNMTLPLELLNYQVRLENGNVKHNWITVNENNTSGYVIECSTNGKDFITVGEVKAFNTPEQHSYYFIDNLNSSIIGILYYRLKQVGKSGEIAYSDVMSIGMKSTKKITMSPNPVKDYLHVYVYDAQSLSLLTLEGKELRSVKLKPGQGDVTFFLGDLMKGLYLVKVVYADNQVAVEKIMVG